MLKAADTSLDYSSILCDCSNRGMRIVVTQVVPLSRASVPASRADADERDHIHLEGGETGDDDDDDDENELEDLKFDEGEMTLEHRNGKVWLRTVQFASATAGTAAPACRRK